MLSSESQRRGRDEDSTDAGQQDIGTIQVAGKAEFAAQTAKPKDHVMGPDVSDMIYE